MVRMKMVDEDLKLFQAMTMKRVDELGQSTYNLVTDWLAKGICFLKHTTCSTKCSREEHNYWKGLTDLYSLCFVKVDLDLGNYERFLDVTLTKDNNITTSKIYKSVLDKEKKGDYLGKTVQVVPHITDVVKEKVECVAVVPVDGKDGHADVCVIELGGTVGDIESMPFIEALRQLSFIVENKAYPT